MAVPLKLNVLGRFEVQLPSGEIVSLPTRKTETLLTYLALVSGPHSRDHLTNLLWSDRGEQQARNSLRQALNALKILFADVKPQPLQIDRINVNLANQSIEIDALKLEELIQNQTPLAAAQAANLYRGEFLEGVVVRDSNGEEWLAVERDRFRRLATHALENALVTQLQSGELNAARETGERFVSIEPLNESAWRQLMRVYATRGERNHALMSYKRCVDFLEKELGVEPAPETIELQISIREGILDAASPDTQPRPVASADHASAVAAGLPVPALTEKPSIAVLPFTNITGDPDQQYFADGMTNTIATELSRIRSLMVKSAITVEANRVSANQTVQELNVDYLLKGSIQKQGDRVRVAAELIDADTGANKWSEHYDRRGENILDIQDEIAQSIIATLCGYQGRLRAVELEHTATKTTRDFNAYDFFLRGVEYKERMTREDNIKALDYLYKTLELDSEYAEALAWLSYVHVMDVVMNWTDNYEESLKQAFDAANRAIKLDKFSEIGHWSLAASYMAKGQNDLGLAAFDKALKINPNNADIMVDKGEALSLSGRAEEGIELIIQGMQLNPYHPEWYVWVLGVAYYTAARYEDAIEALNQMTTHHIDTRLHLAASYACSGQNKEAVEQARQVIELDPEFTLKTLSRSHANRNADVYQHLLNGLRLAGLPE